LRSSYFLEHSYTTLFSRFISHVANLSAPASEMALRRTLFALLLLLASCVVAQLVDDEYQKYAKKLSEQNLYQQDDEETLNRGKAIACGLCNLALMDSPQA
jgi:hypothetical protein